MKFRSFVSPFALALALLAVSSFSPTSFAEIVGEPPPAEMDTVTVFGYGPSDPAGGTLYGVIPLGNGGAEVVGGTGQATAATKNPKLAALINQWITQYGQQGYTSATLHITYPDWTVLVQSTVIANQVFSLTLNGMVGGPVNTTYYTFGVTNQTTHAYSVITSGSVPPN